MAESDRRDGHVFICYAREDSRMVDRLQRRLEDHHIPVWRDKTDIWPGEDWRNRIRDAISRQTLVFIACFSGQSLSRDRGYQNEELTLAVEQLRLFPAGHPWLIPVRFDACDIPDREIGGGRTLSSIQRADLFGADFEVEATRLVHAVRRILGHDSDAVSPDREPSENRPADNPQRASLGERLFTASVGEHAGKLTVAFGADDTLVVTDQNAAIYRWSLSGQTGLPGAPGGGWPPLRAAMTYGMSTQVAVSTTITALAVARGSRCSIVHFTGDGYRTSSLPLGRSEFLVSTSAERFATHDARRVMVRDFTDGTVVWEQPCSRSIVTAAIDMRGTTVAVAGASNSLAPSNRVVMTSQDDPRPREFSFENVRVPGAGCQLGLSPGGELVVCASFQEILLADPSTGQIVRRRRMSSVREEIVPALGTRPHRLICMADGQVLWVRGRRVVDVNWSAHKFHYLPQDGLCDDIAFDHVKSQLAMVNESGQVDVFEWRA